MNAWMWFVDVLVNTTIVFMLSLITRGRTHSFAPYGSNYVSFVVLGFCVHYISWTNLGDPFKRVARIYWGGTMDLYLLSPLSYLTPYMGIMFRSVIDDYPRVILSLAFGGLFFGATYSVAHLPLALLFLLLILLATLGIGMISASSFYLFNFKQSGPAADLVPDLARGFGAVARQDWTAVVDHMTAAMSDLARIGGSRAQRDMVEQTLLTALMALDKKEEAQVIATLRRPVLAEQFAA